MNRNRRTLSASLFALAGLSVLAVLAGSLAGCSPDDGPLAPPPRGQGTQFEMTSMLAPGQEIERCRFFVAPPEGLYIRRDEVRYSPGSHHVLLYRTPYTSLPTMDHRGNAVDPTAVFDCPEGPGSYFQVTGIIGGAQSTHGDSMVDLPDGVAVKVAGGAVLLMNTHYLNASPEPRQTTARINLYTVPKEEVRAEAGVMFLYNPFIRVPEGGTASARLRCRINQDITLVNAQSHMHQRGVGYVAELLAPGSASDAAIPERIYENTAWEEVPVKRFAEGKPIAAGSFIDYRCDYRNTEGREILQGPSARDEMCMFLGAYYPYSREIEACTQPTYMGSGTKSCSEALSCVQQSLSDQRKHIPCIVDSCPQVAAPLTAAYLCMGGAVFGACKAACKADPTQCQSCVQATCMGDITACSAARCL
jgi:hypothetical protein